MLPRAPRAHRHFQETISWHSNPSFQEWLTPSPRRQGVAGASSVFDFPFATQNLPSTTTNPLAQHLLYTAGGAGEDRRVGTCPVPTQILQRAGKDLPLLWSCTDVPSLIFLCVLNPYCHLRRPSSHVSYCQCLFLWLAPGPSATRLLTSFLTASLHCRGRWVQKRGRVPVAFSCCCYTFP